MTRPEMPDSFLTLGEPGRSDIKIQRSRFLGAAFPADSEAAAQACVADMARKYHDSRHVCFAWRLGPGPTLENRNDAGEPSGTAGEPILAAIRRLELTDVVLIVVRYFGGVKLGTGGLQRAYGQAADEALSAAATREVLLGREFTLDLDYAFQKTARHLLERHRGRVLHEEFTDHVAWKIWLPHSTWREFGSSLTEASRGTVDLQEIIDPE